MRVTLDILGQQIGLECAEHERRRLEDLARALDARLQSFPGEQDALRRLALAALSLMDEAQATSAALARARSEIERLTDMVVEARLEAAAPDPDLAARGRLEALRAAQRIA